MTIKTGNKIPVCRLWQTGRKITAHNRIVYAWQLLAQQFKGLTAARPPQWLGHSAMIHFHAIDPAHFVHPANATHLLIRAGKTL
jgi:hypothetical protein